jgi:hypothetical protein
MLLEAEEAPLLQGRLEACPWEKLDNEGMKSYYDLESAHQYALDSNDLVEKVNWVGCRPEDRTFRGENWP